MSGDLTPTRSVLITGASTGIGQACARYLRGLGFQVFAGILHPADAKALSTGGDPLMIPVLLDVTDPAAISAAVVTVTGALAGRRLDGLVNNAGIFLQTPLEFMAIDQFRRLLEVNVLGNIAVTQAFLPLLRKKPGRIVNVGSISGRCAAPLEGAYAASKFALEALTAVLRVELQAYGIRISIIEPGGVATPMLLDSGAALEQMLAGLPASGLEIYGPAIPTMRRLYQHSVSAAMPPERVARVIHRALTARRPRPRYLVGSDAQMLAALAWLPTRLRDALFTRILGLRPSPVSRGSSHGAELPATE